MQGVASLDTMHTESYLDASPLTHGALTCPALVRQHDGEMLWRLILQVGPEVWQMPFPLCTQLLSYILHARCACSWLTAAIQPTHAAMGVSFVTFACPKQRTSSALTKLLCASNSQVFGCTC